MVNVMIFPPNSLILADLIERKGHEVLSLQKAVRKKVKDPDIDSPPMNLTEEDPIKGLKYAAIEVPSGVRGRMSLIGPLIDEAEAAIIVDDAPFGFGCIGCARTNELSAFHLRKRGVPTIELKYPKTKDETTFMVNKINTFLDSLNKSSSDDSNSTGNPSSNGDSNSTGDSNGNGDSSSNGESNNSENIENKVVAKNG